VFSWVGLRLQVGSERKSTDKLFVGLNVTGSNTLPPRQPIASKCLRQSISSGLPCLSMGVGIIALTRMRWFFMSVVV